MLTVAGPRAVFSALLMGLFAATAHAMPVYTVSVGGGTPQSGNTVLSLTTPDSHAAAIAGPAGLGLFAQSSNADGGASAKANLVLNDVVISGPGDFVTASLNLHLTGSLGAVAGANAYAGAYLRVGGGWFEGFINPCVSTLPNQGGCGGGAFPEFYTTGIFQSVTGSPAGTTIDGIFSSPTHTFATNTPFSVELSMEVVANAVGGSSAFADFFHTLTFSTDGPVFSLPPGFTVNSVDGGIVDNHVAPVPLPAAIWMFGSAAGLLSLLRRRRSPRRFPSAAARRLGAARAGQHLL